MLRPPQGGHIPALKLGLGRCRHTAFQRAGTVSEKAPRYAQSRLLQARPEVNTAKAGNKEEGRAGASLWAGSIP